MALDVRKFDVSENCYHNRTSRNNWYVQENLAVRICLLMLDARKFMCAKISTFTVYAGLGRGWTQIRVHSAVTDVEQTHQFNNEYQLQPRQLLRLRRVWHGGWPWMGVTNVTW